MLNDLEMLLKLQIIDYDLGELERSKEYIPDMMENLSREIVEAQEVFARTETELTESKVTLDSLDLESKTQKELLDKFKSQMMSIKTNKEYDALISQIDATKGAIDERKAKISELEDRILTLDDTFDDIKKKAKEAKAQNKKQLEILQEKMDSVGSKVENKVAERDNIKEKISKRTISIYERVRKNRGGDVVVTVKKRACGACYKALPPHRIQEIKRSDQIITCDNCGRMLIWQDGISE